MGLEGIMCKLRDAPYRSGARASWLKIKCLKRGVFSIVGFIAAPAWVRPKLAAEIEYTAMTREGLLRHASFKGLRTEPRHRS